MKTKLILLLSLVLLCLPSVAQPQPEPKPQPQPKAKQQQPKPKPKPATGREPLFGKALATYPITSHELAGATFYLVGGHGGPDPGAIGTYQGHKLHEDEYAYDIVLRLGRELMMRGAKVHFIIQDKHDGIRSGTAAPSPARTNKTNPCSYCDFRDACHFDDNMDAALVRRFGDMTNEEVIIRLRDEAEK